MSLKKNKTIIIAEAGVNHNGNIYLAKKLIDVASKAGADYVKFQTFDVDHLILSKKEFKKWYFSIFYVKKISINRQQAQTTNKSF